MTINENTNKNEKLKTMAFSHSSVNGFKQCPLMFKMTYFEKHEKKQNIYAQWGNLAHFVMESFLTGKIEVWELDTLYKDKYNDFVNVPAPVPLSKYVQPTIEKFEKFFREFEMDLDEYEILSVEEKFETMIEDVKIVVKPDSILKRKSDGKIILYDYKTSSYKKESYESYCKQVSLYAAIYKMVTGRVIDECYILYLKDGREKEVELDYNVVDEFTSTVKEIREEEDWEAKPEEFFCRNICSVRDSCEVKARKFGI
jgi:CRISPR/Cas system-associated exonuclease Cas4 (RecB family)